MKMHRIGLAALLAGLAGAAAAGPDLEAVLVVNGEETLATRAPAPDHLEGALPELLSGWLYRDPATRAMEMDDFDNPGMIAADTGLALWSQPEGGEGKACASCHGDISSMKGVRAAMPKVNAAGTLWSMEDYVNACRTERMGAEAWGWTSDQMKSMTVALSLQSRGMPVDVAIDGPAAPYWEQGREMYYTRYGQLELSCANCHEDNNGNYIRADHLSQGQTNGFPTYRLKQAGIIPIHNRFKGCIRDTRAETFNEGSPEFRALELYVASRGQGLAVEGVAVRP
ncbi:sulfur oxidation c-type cytochrome SoxA [Poseidonocella sp. HB161398]|uniref:sulfur oxidation c-type cytochrome SoxA n=1 Tax=Poseidonocella sp. HB161398 TaxID=2320855 RepID=UPI001109EE5D|nr:sulfur oxidation c-type cytochrome SoxA [Poseidonocella sp. HB161398]